MAPELIEAIAAVHAAGGRIRSDGRTVTVDVDVELPETVWQVLADHRDDLIADRACDYITDESWSQIWPERSPQPIAMPAVAGVDCCDRCGATETVSQEIHGGRSVRLDCAACGRFRKFTTWHGVEMP
jgi:hypothetical protein